MGIDQLKVVYSYSIATFMIVGGFVILYLTYHDTTDQAKNLSLAISGFIGMAVNWVFMRETATNSARQTERAVSITAPPPAPTTDTTGGTTT